MLGTQYGTFELLITVNNLLITKVLFPGSRLIRRPFYLRNRHNFDWGNNLTLGYGCRFDLEGEGKTLRFGNDCKLNDRVHIVAHESVQIGDDVLMASNIFISDTSHGDYSSDSQEGPDIPPDKRLILTKPVVIGNRVWIGEGVCVLPGVTIGAGAVIGSNSVVTHSVPAGAIAVGSPARVVKIWDESKHAWVRC